MLVVSVDLDDTLIPTKIHYKKANEWFANYVNQNYNVDENTAMEKFSEKSTELLDDYGLSKQRFPKSAVAALDDLVSEPSDLDRERVYEIGRSAFKDKNQYQDIGFIDDGTEEFLETVSEKSDISILLTAGDEDIQRRKIKSLDLEKYFDRISIVPMNGKTKILSEYSDDSCIHIGNSSHSDLKAASNTNSDFIYIPRGEWVKNDNQYTGDGKMNTVENIKEAQSILTEFVNENS